VPPLARAPERALPPATLPPRTRPAPRRSGLLVALLALAASGAGIAPFALTRLRQDAATLQQPALTVEVAAEGMRFVPDEMRVPAGKSVAVRFVNRDNQPHDFQTTRQYRDARQVLWPGERRDTMFIAADKPGRYAFICTLRGHAEAGMVGTIVVE
jgi:plastocyanin